LRKELTPAEIAMPSDDNRMISWPYPKRMVANPNVNQGAAIIITSLAKARAAGIAEDQLVFIGAGAVANEPRDWLTRPAIRTEPRTGRCPQRIAAPRRKLRCG
jgi:acetyl-CoA C-acetyltransferase